MDKIFSLVGQILERVQYEAERAKKVVPVLVRFGMSELEDLYHRFNQWRETCDHLDTGSIGAKASKVKRPKSSKGAKTAKSRDSKGKKRAGRTSGGRRP